MHSEHNPIAELIHQIQRKWIEDVSPFPELKLVRWLIKPDQARLYEGFLKLESTEHGAIPEVLITMLTPFQNSETYSLSIIRDWCKAFREDNKTQEKLILKGNAGIWNPETFLSAPAVESENHDLQLLQMLSSFHKEMVDKSMRLVVALFPHSIHYMEGFRQWLTSLLKNPIPHEISFMAFDHVGENYLDKAFEKFPDITKTLHINLDLDGAISKISKMGDPNSPEIKLRECILEMGKALQKQNELQLHHWGEKGLQVTQRSGFKSLYATAHIVYAGMLFNFKRFEQIDLLLEQGLSIAGQGMKLEADSCRPLMIQFYGYIASSKQLQKMTKESILAFEKQGDLALEYMLPGMALTPYRQAYMLSRKNLPERHGDLIKKAFFTGRSMQPDEQLNSCFAAIGLDYLQWCQTKQQWEEADGVDSELKKIFGVDWKKQAKNPHASYTQSTKDVMPVN